MATPGSRLEAVLAAGMARMALVRTDAPKRDREFDVEEALADLLGPEEGEELVDLLDWEFGEEDATPGPLDAAPGERPPPAQLVEDALAQLDRDDVGVDGDAPPQPQLPPPQPPGTRLLFEADAPLRKLPEWISNPLPPRPSVPTRTSTKPPSARAKIRSLTEQERAYVFWYVMHPAELNREIEEVALVLGETADDFRDRAKALRYRLRRQFGIVVPKPFAAPWFGPPLGPAPELPVDSSLHKRDTRGTRLTTPSELRYLYWYAMHPNQFEEDAQQIMERLTIGREELRQKMAKLKQRVARWTAAAQKEAQAGLARASPVTCDNIGVSNVHAGAIETMVAAWKLRPR
tara:strand:- start:204 stop:1244 length:1041 start_codon:yes stop_codon:yes gene_type:complete